MCSVVDTVLVIVDITLTVLDIIIRIIRRNADPR